jgi:hypothetical protein
MFADGCASAVVKVHLPGCWASTEALRYEAVGRLWTDKRGLGAGVEQGGQLACADRQLNMRPGRERYSEGRGVPALSPARDAFPGGGWQSRVNTPSLPHWEQNFFAIRRQSNRVCPRCLQRQQHSFRSYTAAAADGLVVFCRSWHCAVMSSYSSARRRRSVFRRIESRGIYSL